jgi:hypothetical protein
MNVSGANPPSVLEPALRNLKEGGQKKTTPLLHLSRSLERLLNLQGVTVTVFGANLMLNFLARWRINDSLEKVERLESGKET